MAVYCFNFMRKHSALALYLGLSPDVFTSLEDAVRGQQPPSPFSRILWFLIGLLVALAIFGCEKRDETVVHKTLRAREPQPVSLVLFIDRSGSGDNYHVPEMTLRSIVATPIDSIRRHGGNLAVGIIDAHSDKSMCALRIDPEFWPVPPVAPVRDSFSNDLKYREALLNYRNDDLPAYNNQSTALDQEIEERITAFLKCLDLMEGRSVDTSATALFPAVNRAIATHRNAPASTIAFHTVVIGDGIGNRDQKDDTLDSIPGIQYWCAYCTQEARGTIWFEAVKPRMVIDLGTALDLIYHRH
jgi:hypothetical protein